MCTLQSCFHQKKIETSELHFIHVRHLHKGTKIRFLSTSHIKFSSHHKMPKPHCHKKVSRFSPQIEIPTSDGAPLSNHTPPPVLPPLHAPPKRPSTKGYPSSIPVGRNNRYLRQHWIAIGCWFGLQGPPDGNRRDLPVEGVRIYVTGNWCLFTASNCVEMMTNMQVYHLSLHLWQVCNGVL